METTVHQRKHKDYLYIENKFGLEIVKYLGSDTKVIIPEKIYGKKVTSIGKEAFKNNKSICTIICPNTLKMIKAEAFAFCSSLQVVSFNAQLKVIADRAFEGCGKLEETSLHIPYFDFIGEDAFYNCFKLVGKVTYVRTKKKDRHAFCCGYYGYKK